jgi:hypothetical protein
MEEVTIEKFESEFDEYMDLIENKKMTYLIRMPDGRAVVAAPMTDDISKVMESTTSSFDPLCDI